MISTGRIEANQKNAQLSTGPRSNEGKARTRLNALRHGFRSKSALLPGENAEQYYELKARLNAEWKPETQNEEFLVEQLLTSQWRLDRIALMEQDIFVQSFEDSVSDSSLEFDANLSGALTPALLDNKLALLSRYENSIRRAYYKALHELKAIQAERRKTEQAAQKAGHDAAVREAVAEAERENAAFNQKLIEMCEKIPAVPNDGHLYIQPRPRFGSDSEPRP
jgi:hypothetical protein